MKRFLIFCSLLSMSMTQKQIEVSVMTVVSASIGKMVLECQKELEFTEAVINDLLDFWNEKNDLTSEDLGCALVCVFQKNEFLSPDGSKVQEDKAFNFFKVSGADDLMSSRLVDLLLLCKKQTSSIKNFCDSALQMAKCYRYGVFTMHWNPERFYWKHSQAARSQEPYELKMCRGTDCEDISKTELLTKLGRTCKN